MRKLASIVVIVFSLVVPAGAVYAQDEVKSDSSADSASAPPQTWYSSWAEGSKAAAQAKRQMLLVIQAEWCRWCQAMNDSTWISPDILRNAGTIAFVRVDGDLDSATVAKYHVSRFPTTILASDKGVEIDRFVGYFGPTEMQSELTRALEGTGTLWELERKQTESKGDPKITLAMAREYLERGEPVKAQEFLTRVKAVDQSGDLGVNDDALFIEAQIQRDEKNWYKAIEVLKKLIKDYPESEWREDADLYIPWLYAQTGDNKEAAKKYNEFLDKYGSSSETQWVKRQIAKLETPTEAPSEAPTEAPATPATPPEGQ